MPLVSSSKLDRKHYTFLINKLKPLEEEEHLGDDLTLGLLVMILGLIYMKGNSAREAQVWKMLRRVRVLPSKYHFLFGYPKRVTEDLCSSDTSITGSCLTLVHQNINSVGGGPRNNQEISKT